MLLLASFNQFERPSTTDTTSCGWAASSSSSNNNFSLELHEKNGSARVGNISSSRHARTQASYNCVDYTSQAIDRKTERERKREREKFVGRWITSFVFQRCLCDGKCSARGKLSRLSGKRSGIIAAAAAAAAAAVEVAAPLLLSLLALPPKEKNN